MFDSKAFTLSMAMVGLLTMWPADVDAQGHRGPSHGGGWHGGAMVGGYYGPWVGYYSPYLFYDPFWGYPFGWYYPYAYAAVVDHLASVRLQVEPRQAEVFVDGYLAGSVDDFDGTFQRLRLDPGEHELTLYAQGYRTIRQKLLLQPGGTFRIKYSMQPLAPGEAPEPRPVPRAEAPPATKYDAFGRPLEQAPARAPASSPGPESAPSPAAEGFGTLAVRVRPQNAEISIDGERWDRSDAEQRLELQLASGSHTVEVRLDGYRPYRSDVQVKPGETVTINVSLSRQ